MLTLLLALFKMVALVLFSQNLLVPTCSRRYRGSSLQHPCDVHVFGTRGSSIYRFMLVYKRIIIITLLQRIIPTRHPVYPVGSGSMDHNVDEHPNIEVLLSAIRRLISIVRLQT